LKIGPYEVPKIFKVHFSSILKFKSVENLKLAKQNNQRFETFEKSQGESGVQNNLWLFAL
jgi:hypothetical protein